MPLPKKEKLIKLGVETLSDLISNIYKNNRDIRKEIDAELATITKDPKKIASLIKKDISSIKRSTKFIDYSSSHYFSAKLDNITSKIKNNLVKIDPNLALQLMLDFLDNSENIIGNCDDSNGDISGSYRWACEELGVIASLCNLDQEQIVDIVYEKYIHNGYCLFDDIIINFKKAFNDKGLKILTEKINNTPEKKYDYSKSLALKQIADCSDNIDEYIEACTKNGLHDYERIDIARRLIDKWQAEEALRWLSKVENPNSSYDYNKTLLEALELAGKYEEAQNCRISDFEKSLSSTTFGEILKHSKETDFKETFTAKAINLVYNYPVISSSVDFLIKIQEFEKAANLIIDKSKEISGDSYYTYRPITKLLKDINPLATTILHRVMALSVLIKAKSKYYSYAAKDIIACEQLSKKINDWKGFQNHNEFMEEVELNNKRKMSFWHTLEEEVKKVEKKNG